MTCIRDATLEDAGRILQIYDHYVRFTAVSFEYETPDIDEFRGRMRTVMARYPYLVAEENGRVMGYAYAHPFVGRAAYDWSCELTIYLDPAARRRGMGRQLYQALEDALARMGVLNLYACIGCPCNEDDEYLTMASANFHARLGFTNVGVFRKCGYKFGRWYDMVWMEKLIGTHGHEQAVVRSYDETRPRD